MILRQLFDATTSTYTYLLADPATGRAALIDPVAERVDRDLLLLAELGLELTFVLDTHVHADHVTGSGLLRERTGAKTVVAARSEIDCADIHAKHGDRLALGALEVEVRETPGHTGGCLSYVVQSDEGCFAFTGDALLIRGCGRTDFQDGDAATLYRSVHEQLFALPDETVVLPGHDYRGFTRSTIGEEKAHNPRLRQGTDEAAFVQIMGSLVLAEPSQMDTAVPANLSCGRTPHAPGGTA